MNTISEYKLAAIQPRKTHPMVLVAATGLTIFSILGSAAITGLIPTTHYERSDMTADKTMILTLPEPSVMPFTEPTPSVQHSNQDHLNTQRLNSKSKHRQPERIMSDDRDYSNSERAIA
ncbi:MAG TPA: hypothetical protein VK974_05550 [Methylophilaceae bacterium]|nr:hypothetical protein [Methylophilaceae bacterium]